ncbi:MAG: DNA-directed RNA polymerase subunit beta [Thermoguttaceae bacterium]|nr:DNA-directed RNA polymerase subunit beta [Thermoguttaceae bacterium]
MATKAQRRIQPKEVRRFGSLRAPVPVGDLTKIQTESYEIFLQYGIPADKRDDRGLESVLREVFPIESNDKQIRLEYVRYELGKPRYEADECRQLRLTYGRPLRVTFRLSKGAGGVSEEEEVYLGELPIMLGGGEFIINGAERVVVNQLHRSPGIDFVAEMDVGERRLHNCRIIPERGSWVEINVTRKDALSVRIDQSGKFPALTLLRAMDPRYSDNSSILRAFYPTEKVTISGGESVKAIEGRIAVEDVVYPVGCERAGEIMLDCGQKITKTAAEEICASGLTSLEVMEDQKNPLLINSLADDPTASHEEALLRIYQRLRPGNPPQLDKAKLLFDEKFRDTNRYRLGRVGRFRINRKLHLDTPETELTLQADDLVAAMRYMLALRMDDPSVEVDDIDHLGNRRLRTIEELACDELRKGFLKLRRTAQDRMQMRELGDMTPRSLVNPKSISAAIEYFFGRGELSQVVDQTNPLSTLTHERRLSALGPGGLNRKRAGFEVRDVHNSHYGRICPIETPEGTNIGLISSLAIYASVDEYGFLVTPYQRVENGTICFKKDGAGNELLDEKGKRIPDIVWLRADEEFESTLIPADQPLNDDKIVGDSGGMLVARALGDFQMVPVKSVQYMDVAAAQMVGVSAGLIPFLEHDDANRALMGSNMQRQAVPLLISEPPIVGTGLERDVARNSGMVVRSKRTGYVKFVDAGRIIVADEEGEDEYVMRKFVGLNERTCQNQKPIVMPGQKVQKGEIIADGGATFKGELALGRNVLAAFMSWDGYNYEDAIIISEELVMADTYTSLHIEDMDVEIRETKLGREEFTRDIPNVSEKALRNLDENGIVRVGTYVRPGDILVGKVTPKSRAELTPEEKLLHAIFGRAGEEVKNESLEVPSGVEGIVINTVKFARRTSLSPEERERYELELKEKELAGTQRIRDALEAIVAKMESILGERLKDSRDGLYWVEEQPLSVIPERASRFRLDSLLAVATTDDKRTEVERAWRDLHPELERALDQRERNMNLMKQGEELRNGVLQMAKVYIATKRVISVGDKMAGRHGNKGVISRVLPMEDMPFLPDGTPMQILLNPLGVPSRMNVGQILETHLGWAGVQLGFQAVTPVFNGASEEDIRTVLESAPFPTNDRLEKDERSFPTPGKTVLYDGRTGEPFEQKITVGYIYMLKLHHLVDDKVHARSTGPYSLITQQPLGGKARFGGQRFGEMEVWALEAYGAAYVLQELLTVKSDDVEGRTKIYESMVKGENTLQAGTPASFDVLTNEIRGLALNMQLEKLSDKTIQF